MRKDDVLKHVGQENREVIANANKYIDKRYGYITGMSRAQAIS